MTDYSNMQNTITPEMRQERISEISYICNNKINNVQSP